MRGWSTTDLHPTLEVRDLFKSIEDLNNAFLFFFHRPRIIDDDVDFKSLLPDNLENTLEEDVGDNEPTVADIIDERPDHIKRLEAYRASGKWKTVNDNKNGICSIK